MVSDQTGRAVSRRRLLEAAGAGGIAIVAGCTQSGGSDGLFPLEVILEVPTNDPDRVAMVEIIQRELDRTEFFNASVEQTAFNQFTERVLSKEYAERGLLPVLGLAGTFNPGSFADALHRSGNWGQCCNLTGIEDEKVDRLLNEARFGEDVANDSQLRGEKYDELWKYLSEQRYSSFLNFNVNTAITTQDVHSFSSYVRGGNIIPYSLHSPQDEQVAWIDRENPASGDDDLSDLKEGGTFVGSVENNVSSFDPPYNTSAINSGVQALIFEGLTTTGIDGTVYPWLAKRYELRDSQDIDRTAYEPYMQSISVATTDGQRVVDTEEQIIVTHPDDSVQQDDEVRVLTPEDAAAAVDDGTYGMQYRYNLHEGVTFHDGEELTADNVTGTVKRYENSDVSAQTFDTVLHARKVDEYTVDIYAQVIDAEAERLLPGFSIHASAQLDAEGGAIDPIKGNPPIGTGPFEFDSFEDSQSVTVTKYDNYWLEEIGLSEVEWFDGPEEFPDGPVVDEVDIQIVTDANTRSSALQTGEIDEAYRLPAESVVSFKDNDEFNVYQVQADSYNYMQYPVKVSPWDDERLRQAVNYLIPRERIVEEVYQGQASPPWTPIPQLVRGSGSADYDALESELKPKNQYKPEKATELLQEVRSELEDQDLDFDPSVNGSDDNSSE